jgi:hypothetical protein
MNPVEAYLTELREIRSYPSVEETSFYGTLEKLLNEIGKALKPKVRCIINPSNAGAGIPDGGLFTPDQKSTDMIADRNLIPSRGVVEVKGIGEDLKAVAGTEQVQRYLRRYEQVLVTNYWDFLLIGRNAGGEPFNLEPYSLCPTAGAFREALVHPRKLADEQEDWFTEYLVRVILRAAELTDPKDLAQLLASYAREAKARVKGAELPALESIRRALEEALGMEFKGDKGEHFFRSTLVQTLFYGMFSAWVLWSRKQRDDDTSARFEWRTAAWELHVPMVRALFEEVSRASRLEELKLVEILDWAGDALNRVKRRDFFESFEKQSAVQYFYEPFLEAFDPALRKELGIWYTPPEIVQYMVARVDTVLREELGIEDGLADRSVFVLDPACGTGAYLVEVLKRIETTVREKKGGGALVAAEVKKAAMERVFGFEILPAPFVVSHLQLGLLLQTMNAPLKDATERAAVYLTNSLTGWEPPTEEVKKRLQHLQLSFPDLKEEHDAAQKVKRDVPILVVMGNPPWNAFAGVATDPEEQRLVEPYKQGLISEWGIKKFNLDDLYVRFFRLAERRIAEMTGRGVVCYISNFSYLRDPSFVVLRRRFLEEFDALWFDNMNGDSRETGKLTPEGKPDPSVFSTQSNREGIRVGTAIALMVRGAQHAPRPAVRFRQFWGAAKRSDLVESLKVRDFDAQYEPVQPDNAKRFSFRPSRVTAGYLAWPKLVDLCFQGPYQGLAEDRRKALIDTDEDLLTTRMRMYLDVSIGWEELKSGGGPLTESYVDFPAESARHSAHQSESFSARNIRRYFMRPFDTQYCYYTSTRPIWRRHRPEFYRQASEGNGFVTSRFHRAKDPEGVPMGYVVGLCDYHYLAPNVGAIPIHIRSFQGDQGKPERGSDTALLPEVSANLSEHAREYLDNFGFGIPDADPETARLMWMHALAIGYSPAYLTENADGIREDWPRIPLPGSKDLLVGSAGLGRTVASLLDTENEVAGVTAGDIRPELKVVAVPSRAGGGGLDPNADLDVTAGWGHAGKDGVTMPGKGKAIQREYTWEERRSIEDGAAGAGLSAEQAFDHLGETTFDIHLNEVAYWKNVPAKVWDYTIGGYQVIKKWLSYREKKLLGRPLTADEVREVQNMAHRIAAILLLEPELDASYAAVKANTYPWPQSS